MGQELNVFEQAVLDFDTNYPFDKLIYGYLGSARTAKLTFTKEDPLYLEIASQYPDKHLIPLRVLRKSTSKHYDMYTKDKLYEIITNANKSDLMDGGYALIRRLVKVCFDPAKVRHKRNELLANLDRSLVITGAYKDFKLSKNARPALRYDIQNCRFPDASRYEKESLDDLDSYYDHVYFQQLV